MNHWMARYPAPATWGDVFVDQPGRIGCAVDNGAKGDMHFFEIQNDNLVKIGTFSNPFPEVPLFIRAEKSKSGIYAMIAKGHDSGKFMTFGIEDINVFAYGTHSADIIQSGSGFRYAVQTGQGTYYDSIHGDLLIPEVIFGTSQGMIQLTEDGPIWSDLARQSVPEMFYPYNAGSVILGEGATDPAHMQALEGNKQLNIYEGYAARPRACIDLSTNLLAVAARSESGVDFHFYRLPFAEPQPMACTPIPVGHDILAPSFDRIADFCLSYKVPDSTNVPDKFPPGSMPYKGDAAKGAWFSQGLCYFMFGDTGKYAQTLMNPDDKRPTDQKVKAAEDNLFKYMKNRCGDFT